jgi:FkbM family methyltransferase
VFFNNKGVVFMFRYLKYYDYYLELFFKKIGGKGDMNFFNNGEFRVLDKIIQKSGNGVVFVDGGANIGEHSLHFIKLCKKYNKKTGLFSIEPFPSTRKVLSNNLKGNDCQILPFALGDQEKKVKFYYDKGEVSGSNSVLPHYYLSGGEIEVQQVSLDKIAAEHNISKIDFLKLDIEGAEFNALNGAKSLLQKKRIRYIQLEYNQTWIKGGGSIEKVLDLCKKYDYRLYRITKFGLLSIPSYHYVLDDFFYSNLLLVSSGEDLPMRIIKKALPFL